VLRLGRNATLLGRCLREGRAKKLESLLLGRDAQENVFTHPLLRDIQQRQAALVGLKGL
jgi:hypothetical protein